jgi:hypothetical protein
MHWAEMMVSVVSRVTYKPNMTLAFDPDPVHDIPVLQVAMIGPDSRDVPGPNGWPQKKLGFKIVFPEYMRRDDFLEREAVAWIKEQLLRIEKHERDEWLRLDGEMIHDPHVNGQNQL